MTVVHSINMGIPSILVAASSAITSASVDKWLTAPYFLHIQFIGTNVFGPHKTQYAPVVDFESVKSAPKLASAYCTTDMSFAWSPT